MRVIRAALAAVGLLLLEQLTVASSASACDVSYGYKPTISFGPGGFGQSGTCSTGTSLSGVLVVVIVGAVLLGLWLKNLYRRGRRRAEEGSDAESGPPGDGVSPGGAAGASSGETALESYLSSVGLGESRRP